jgi:hypothetical protein
MFRLASFTGPWGKLQNWKETIKYLMTDWRENSDDIEAFESGGVQFHVFF